MTKRPEGLRWKMVLSSMYFAGTTGLITCSSSSSRILSLETSGACCVEMRMVCTRSGTTAPPSFLYSTVTCVVGGWGGVGGWCGCAWGGGSEEGVCRGRWRAGRQAAAARRPSTRSHHPPTHKPTWVLPSGRSQGQTPFLRTSVSLYPSWVASMWVRGMSSGVSSVAYPNMWPCAHTGAGVEGGCVRVGGVGRQVCREEGGARGARAPHTPPHADAFTPTRSHTPTPTRAWSPAPISSSVLVPMPCTPCPMSGDCSSMCTSTLHLSASRPTSSEMKPMSRQVLRTMAS